jgi:hypothetical protein
MHAVSELPGWLLALGALLLLATIVTFFFNAGQRAQISRALKSGPNRKPLRLFDLSYGNVGAKLEQRDLVVPEELWTYDADYIERFAKAASRADLPNRQMTALALYIGPVLRWDVAFAVALGLFIAIVGFAAAALMDEPLLGGPLIFCGSMGLVYGAADVAEDLKLISILRDWHAEARRHSGATIGEHADLRIDGGEAAAASALTRIKIITITLSIVGLAIFLVLAAIAAVVYRTPGSPTPAPSQDGQPAIAPG